MSDCPLISQELIDYLEGKFPDTTPNITDSDREIWSKVGNVQVVRFLKRKFEEQFEIRTGRKLV